MGILLAYLSTAIINVTSRLLSEKYVFAFVGLNVAAVLTLTLFFYLLWYLTILNDLKILFNFEMDSKDRAAILLVELPNLNSTLRPGLTDAAIRNYEQ